jgi:hypothetical protein
MCSSRADLFAYNRASPFRINLIKDGQIDDWFFGEVVERNPRQ